MAWVGEYVDEDDVEDARGDFHVRLILEELPKHVECVQFLKVVQGFDPDQLRGVGGRWRLRVTEDEPIGECGQIVRREHVAFANSDERGLDRRGKGVLM